MMKKIVLSIFAIAAMTFMCARIVNASPKVINDSGGAIDLGDPVSVNLDVYYIPSEEPVNFPLTKNYGSKVSMASQFEGMPTEYIFSFWIVNGFVRLDLPYDYQFIITENLDLDAVYRPVGDTIVCFMDSNRKLISWQYNTTSDPFTSADVPSLTAYSKPGYELSATPWGSTIDFDHLTSDTFLTLQYVPNELPNTYTIAVTNGTGGGTYDFDSIVTVVADAAPSEQYFSYWEDESGNFISNQPTYSFTAYENRHLTAIYDTYPWEDIPYATLSEPMYLRDGKVTFVGQFYLPEGYELIEYGINITDNYDFYVEYKASNLNPQTNEFVMTFDAEWGRYANIEVTYIDPYVSEMVSRLNNDSWTLLVPNHPIISEYGEGSSFNKWIEIYNPSGFDSIDLSRYELQLYTDGSSTASHTSELSGTILPGEVYVISHGSANSSILAIADSTSSTLINFNGNDAFALYYKGNDSVIDVIGEIGVNPGTSWSWDTGSTINHTLYRNIGIYNPNSTWDTSEWTVLPQDDISKLGYHENRIPSSIGYEGNGTLSLMVGQTFQLEAVYNNPIDSIRGHRWESDNELVATVDPDTGLLTAVSEGSAMIFIYSTENPDVYSGSRWTFTAPTYYSVDATSSNVEHGTVSASPTSVLEDGSTTITITPASGYYTDYISVNGVVTELDGTNTYTINNITANQTVVVTFDALNTISVSSNNNDYGTVSSSVSSVMDGKNATLTFSPASGYRTDYLTINGTTTVQLDGAISYQLTNITSNQEIVVTFEVSETQVETLVKTIGFESSEGFTATTSYNNTTEIFTGNTGQQWGTYYGTPSTTGPISGSQSMQMRYYTSAPANYGYTYMNYDINGVTKVMFTAKNYANVADVKVSYSTDGGVTWIDVDTINLTTTATEYTVNINFTGNVRIKFTLTGTTVAERLTIDNVKIYGMR